MKNIVLIGISGSGKTAIGKRLAKELHREFIDIDDLIVKRESMAIELIFTQRGEKGFRSAETEAIKSIARCKNAVIACGGGVILKDENMDLLSQNSIVAFMNRPVDHVLSSVNLCDRPLLARNPDDLYRIHRERLHLYEKYADVEVNCAVSESEILKQLIHISHLETASKRLAVIGDPIEHSLSPQIHLAALNPLLKCVSYERIRVEKGRLKSMLMKMKQEGYDGFNVTMPHKEDIIEMLDVIEEGAMVIGSVNTVVNKLDGLSGFSTDGDGLSNALKNAGKKFKDESVVIIGTGGAAAAIAMTAANKGARKIILAGRNEEKADNIIKRAGLRCETEWQFINFPLISKGQEFMDVQILINSTPLGMKDVGEDFKSFSFLDAVDKDAIVFDIVYNPLKTSLLKEAESRGLKTLNGITMLIEQALISDCLYLSTKIGRVKAYERAVEKLEMEMHIK